MAKRKDFLIECDGDATHCIRVEGADIQFLDHPDAFESVDAELTFRALGGDPTMLSGCCSIALLVRLRNYSALRSMGQKPLREFANALYGREIYLRSKHRRR